MTAHLFEDEADLEAQRRANRRRFPALAQAMDALRAAGIPARVRQDPFEPGVPLVRDHSTLPPEAYDRLKASGVEPSPASW